MPRWLLTLFYGFQLSLRHYYFDDYASCHTLFMQTQTLPHAADAVTIAVFRRRRRRFDDIAADFAISPIHACRHFRHYFPLLITFS
jgi:hypothetical protein